MIYLILFLEFFKVGLFCFGGAFGMIPLIEETVVKHQWLTEGEFYDLIGICESTPGPIAVNIATFVGSNEAGLLGSIVATLGIVMPSFIIILLIASILKNFSNNIYFKMFLSGVKPVVIALIISTGLILFFKTIGYNSIKSFNINFISVIIFGLLCLLYFTSKYVFKKKISSILLIIISAVLGIGVCMINNLL